ncbi:MAG: hypothetical protein M9962_03305 [Oligoflexia bacterium]|nr:hypothetical protein [Oligoflexia bacterium]
MIFFKHYNLNVLLFFILICVTPIEVVANYRHSYDRKYVRIEESSEGKYSITSCEKLPWYILKNGGVFSAIKNGLCKKEIFTINDIIQNHQKFLAEYDKPLTNDEVNQIILKIDTDFLGQSRNNKIDDNAEVFPFFGLCPIKIKYTDAKQFKEFSVIQAPNSKEPPSIPKVSISEYIQKIFSECKKYKESMLDPTSIKQRIDDYINSNGKATDSRAKFDRSFFEAFNLYSPNRMLMNSVYSRKWNQKQLSKCKETVESLKLKITSSNKQKEWNEALSVNLNENISLLKCTNLRIRLAVHFASGELIKVGEDLAYEEETFIPSIDSGTYEYKDYELMTFQAPKTWAYSYTDHSAKNTFETIYLNEGNYSKTVSFDLEALPYKKMELSDKQKIIETKEGTVGNYSYKDNLIETIEGISDGNGGDTEEIVYTDYTKRWKHELNFWPTNKPTILIRLTYMQESFLPKETDDGYKEKFKHWEKIRNETIELVKTAMINEDLVLGNFPKEKRIIVEQDGLKISGILPYNIQYDGKSTASISRYVESVIRRPEDKRFHMHIKVKSIKDSTIKDIVINHGILECRIDPRAEGVNATERNCDAAGAELKHKKLKNGFTSYWMVAPASDRRIPEPTYFVSSPMIEINGYLLHLNSYPDEIKTHFIETLEVVKE